MARVDRKLEIGRPLATHVSIVLGLSMVLQMMIMSQGCSQEGPVPAGTWRKVSYGNNTMHMALFKKEGNVTKQFVMSLKGAITGASGQVTKLEGTVQTLADDTGNASKIISTKLVNGTLVISNDVGQTYIIYDVSPNGGMIMEQNSAK